MNKLFKGIYSALITPFDKDGVIDFKQLEKIIEFEVNEVGVDGLYICGSTGEAFLLGYEEKREILKMVSYIVKNKLNSKVKIIAQIGGLNFMEIEKLSKDVKEFGYDGISAVTPYYYGYKFVDIKRYYEYVTSVCDLPLLIYYLPALTAINISFDNFNELLNLKNVAGVKYSSPDLFMLERLISRNPDKTFLFGVDEFLMAATTLGIDGGIGSTYNLMGKDAKRIFELTKGNKIQEAKELTSKYNILLKKMLDAGIYQSLKQSVAYAAGVGETYCRMPMGQIDDNARTVAKQLVKEIFGK